MRRGNRRCGVVLAAATGVVLGAFAHCRAGITYSSGSRVTLTHDADVSNNADVKFSTGRIPVPNSINIFPVNPYQMDHTFTSGTANSLATGSLGRITNATTASFVLATGTGVTQTDPINAYPGESSLKLDVDLAWNVTSGGWGPLANGFASLNTGIVVGVGGSAEIHINLEFLDQNNNPLRTPWVVNKAYGQGTYAETFATSRVLGGGVLASATELHVKGSIEFLASNADSPSSFIAQRAEFGGAPPTAICITNAQGGWFDPRNWQQQTVNPNEPGLLTVPNGEGQRAWLAGTSAVQSHDMSITDNIKLGTLDIGSPTPYNITGTAPITWSTQQGEAVLNIRQPNGSHSFTNPMILSSQLDTIVEGNSILTLSGPISGSQGIAKFGAGMLVLNATNNSYSGPTIVNEGKLQFSGIGATPVTLNPGSTLEASGTIRNLITARSGSHISPGINGIGGVTFEALAMDPDSVLDIEGAGSTFDSIDLSGNINTFKDGKLNLIRRSQLEPGNFPLIRYNGEPLGNLTGQLSLVERQQGNLWATLFDDATSTTVMVNLIQIPQWNVNANGSWGAFSNWSSGIPPVGPTALAGFLGKITAARTVTLDGPRLVGTMVFDNSHPYTVATGSGGGLTVGDTTHPGLIEVTTGSHIIAAPLTTSGDTEIKIAPGQALTVGGQFHISNDKVVTKTGEGTLNINGTQIHGTNTQLNVNGGTLNLNSDPGTTAFAPLTVNVNGSKVVLGANADLAALNVNFGAAGAQTFDLNSPATAGGFRTLRVYGGNLAAAKAALWNAIINANQPGAPDPLDGIIDSNPHVGSRIGIISLPNQVLVRPTRIGDVNLDGAVTISDFIDLSSHFNQIGTATWQDGDVNYDRSVTIADFIDLASNFNSSYAGETWPISQAEAAMLADFAAANGASVPEPGLGLVMLALAPWLGRCRRAGNLRK